MSGCGFMHTASASVRLSIKNLKAHLSFTFIICGNYLLKCGLQSVLPADGQFAHNLPADLQLLHLLLQPVSVGCAAPGQVPHRALQRPDASRSLPQLLLEGLRGKTEFAIVL